METGFIFLGGLGGWLVFNEVNLLVNGKHIRYWVKLTLFGYTSFLNDTERLTSYQATWVSDRYNFNPGGNVILG